MTERINKEKLLKDLSGLMLVDMPPENIADRHEERALWMRYNAEKLIYDCIEQDIHEDCKPPKLERRETLTAVDYADGTGEIRKSNYADWFCPDCGAWVGERYLPRNHEQQICNYCPGCGLKMDWNAVKADEKQAVDKSREEKFREIMKEIEEWKNR